MELQWTDEEIQKIDAKIEVKRTLAERYGLDRESIDSDFESVASNMGLSGNLNSDLSTLRSDDKEIKERAGKVLKVQERSIFENIARTVPASASRLTTSILRGLDTIGRKGIEFSAQNMPLGTTTPAGFKGPEIEMDDTVSRFFRDIGDISGKVYGEDPGFRQTFGGKLVEGGTQLIGQVGTLGVGLVPQMYNEAVSEAEGFYEMPYEEMSEDMQKRIDATAGIYSVVGAALERIGLGKITKKIPGRNSSGIVKRMLNIGEAMATEGITESAQGETLELLSKAIQDEGREWWTSETVMQRLEEFLLGSILGGGARGTFEGGDALYQKFLNPETGATKTDFKAIQDVEPDDVAQVVFEKTGDASKAELAAKAHQGDEQARKEYIDSHYYEEGETSEFEQILEPEELEAINFEPEVDPELDAEAGQREMTPEEQKLAQAELSEELQEGVNPKEEQKFSALQIRAIESRKREKLRASAARKLEAEVGKRTEAILKKAQERGDLTSAVKELEAMVQALPLSVRGKFKGFGTLSTKVSKTAQKRFLERAKQRIENIFDSFLFKENKSILLKTVSKFKTNYAPNRKKLLKRVGEKAVDELKFISSLIKDEEAKAPKSIETERADDLRNVFGGILAKGNESSPARIGYAARLAKDILEFGRDDMIAWNVARKAKNKERNDQAVDTILKGEELATEQQLKGRKNKTTAFSRSYDTAMALFFHPLNGLKEMMNVLDGKAGGFIDKNFASKANEASQTEMTLHREHVSRTQEDLNLIFDEDIKKQAQWFQNSDEKISTGIEYVNENGSKSELELTRLELVDLLTLWGDSSLESTFEKMEITEQDIKQARELATSYGEKLADYLREQYADIGLDIQSVHKETEGFAMDLVEGYGGRVYRAGVTIKPDDTMFGFSSDGSRATVKSGSMKERVNSVKPLIFSDAFAKFERHMREAHHYISHAALAKDFFATFKGNNTVRKAIEQRHGDEFLDQLDALVDDIINGRMKREGKMYRLLNSLRAKVTKASLAIKPIVAIKQLSSFPAFIEVLGFKGYTKAFADFSTDDPMQWMKKVYDTDYVKNRFSTSFYADIQDQIKSHSEVLGKKTITDVMMINVKAGDIGAVVLGGTPVYRHTYKKAIESGKSETEAEIEAEAVFGDASENAQQSSAMFTRGSYLRDNAWTRTWFMYMTSPIMYQRKVNVATYNYAKAIIDQKKGNNADVTEAGKQFARAVLIFHVILPQIFQSIASGFLAFSGDDDARELFWKRQLHTLLYGNFTVFPVVGQLLEGIGKMIAGNEKEVFRDTGSPLLDLFEETSRHTMDIFKDGESEDWMNLASDVSKLKGIPLDQFVDYYDTFKDIKEGDTEYPIRRLLGLSEWALGESD